MLELGWWYYCSQQLLILLLAVAILVSALRSLKVRNSIFAFFSPVIHVKLPALLGEVARENNCCHRM
jgi:hypothetical protein